MTYKIFFSIISKIIFYSIFKYNLKSGWHKLSSSYSYPRVSKTRMIKYKNNLGKVKDYNDDQNNALLKSNLNNIKPD